MESVRAEIITIGDEILYGHILDTNSKWISEQLDTLGIRVGKKITVGDTPDDILHSFKEAQAGAELVLITGGLGPTNDDITKASLANFFNVSMEINDQALEELTALFKHWGREVTETNREQAMLPANCEMISNTLGSAPGMWFDENNTVFISMPGVPHEMKKMMEDTIIPRIEKRFRTPHIFHKIIRTTGIGESWLSDKITQWEAQLPDHIKLAYLPSVMEVKLRLTASGDKKEELQADVAIEVGKLKPLIEKYIFGFDSDSLEDVVGKILKKKKLTVSTAESCTGGYLGHMITRVPGSSHYFLGGIVSYDNTVKSSVLGVDEAIITKYGAVSKETAMAMASSVRSKFKSDIGLSTTGVAGPSGGTKEKPVGTVWIGLADHTATIAKRFSLSKERMINIQASAKIALNMVRIRLTENNQESI